MRVFVTGATGFLGAEIVRALAARGHVCAGLARSDEGAGRLVAKAPGATVLRGDLFTSEHVRGALVAFRPEAFIHCGWHGVAGANRNDFAQLDNVAASAKFAQMAIDAGARIIIGVGSQAEYQPKSGPLDEADLAAPETLYGVAKHATAGAFAILARLHGARCVWGRVFSLYGPDNDGAWLVPSLIRSLSTGVALELTKCEQIWEFSHVRDVAEGFVALLETPQADGVFNVASGAPIVLRDAVLMLREFVAPQGEIRFGAVAYRPDQVMHLEAKIDRIRAATGWSPRISLREGFQETVAKYAQDRKAA